jgi:hypothetical protein
MVAITLPPALSAIAGNYLEQSANKSIVGGARIVLNPQRVTMLW